MSIEPGRQVNLREARERAPAVNPLEAMRRQLALGLFGAVKENDLAELAAKLKAMALDGDLKAMKLYFDLVMPKGEPEVAASSDSDGLRMMAASLRDLTNEVRRAKKKPPKVIEPASNGDAGIDAEF